MFRIGTRLTKRLPINFIKRFIFRVKIEGDSAWPQLIPGKYYFATSIKKPKKGDFIVFQNPKDKLRIFVKKVHSIDGDYYTVSGSVSWSSSSKDFGPVHKDLILGRVINKS